MAKRERSPEEEARWLAWTAKMRAYYAETYPGKVESGLDMIDENNEGELLISLGHIVRLMKSGRTYGEAVQLFGIRGHPYFAEFWAPTPLWGDAKWADETRKRLAKEPE
ncbi:MAG: hypothetical protein H0U69_03675 [Trueperaceae bacterium]|nr:hypothetical protein [Trueperaceae bacterium]